MSDTYGVGPSSYDPAATDLALRMAGTPGAPGLAPIAGAISAAGGYAQAAANPIMGLLLQISSMLGINPMQLASSIVSSPESVADGLDSAGAPSPDAVAPVGGDGTAEALSGSEPIDYAYDPLTEAPPGPEAGVSASMGVERPPPVAGTGTDVGVVAPRGAAPPVPGDLGAVLSGVEGPQAPTVPQVGSAGVPSANSLQTAGMDEIIRSALAVANPQQQALTLQNALRRS